MQLNLLMKIKHQVATLDEADELVLTRIDRLRFNDSIIRVFEVHEINIATLTLQGEGIKHGNKLLSWPHRASRLVIEAWESAYGNVIALSTLGDCAPLQIRSCVHVA